LDRNFSLPSSIAYIPDEATQDKATHDEVAPCRRYGYNIDWSDEKRRLCFLKLMLGQEEDQHPEDVLDQQNPSFEQLQERLEAAEVSVVQAITHFLAELRSKLQQALEMRQLTNVRYHFALTMPAIWPDRAVTEAIHAAEKAFLGSSVFTISEPEAAAHHVMKDPNQIKMKPGDVCIICDAGGGTIDVISYEVTQVEPTIRLREAAVGEGVRGGGVHLDARINARIESHFGPEKYQELRESEHFVKNWNSEVEKIKAGYPPEDETKTSYTLVVDPTIPQSIELQRTDVDDMYELEINKIQILVDNQTADLERSGKSPEHIFLVGGFSSSPRVRERLVELYPKLGIVQAQDSRYAVALGAVHAFMDKEFITSRRSRDNIGVLTMEPVHKKKRDQRNTIIDAAGQCFELDQIQWLIERNQELGTTIQNTKDAHFNAKLSLDEKFPKQYSIWFIISRREPRPTCLVDGQSGMDEWIELNVDLDKYKEMFDIRKNRQRRYRVLDFQLNVRYSGTSLVFHLKIRGKEVEVLAKQHRLTEEDIWKDGQGVVNAATQPAETQHTTTAGSSIDRMIVATATETSPQQDSPSSDLSLQDSGISDGPTEHPITDDTNIPTRSAKRKRASEIASPASFDDMSTEVDQPDDMDLSTLSHSQETTSLGPRRSTRERRLTMKASELCLEKRTRMSK
jgi:actin-like ATPase involved in cell morphogenesis